jgi:NAD(P)-dependent dehydrogenase (short-subunit alcohol dehydrogenase family)
MLEGDPPLGVGDGATSALLRLMGSSPRPSWSPISGHNEVAAIQNIDPREGQVMREFIGKAAFVTGGASGIGLALGRALAEVGCKVMLADIEKTALDAALASLSGSGREIRGFVCDVADTSSVDAAAQATFSAFGKVHILCNNAGVGILGGIDHIALDDCRWVLDVNLIGVVNGVRAFLPHMRAHGEGGHIVNTASMAGMVNSHQAGGQGFAPYPASKYAVVGMSEGLAMEVKPLGIGVSILCPGVVRTNILESARGRHKRYGPATPVDSTNPLYAGFVEHVRTGMDPDEVARRVVAAIRNDELYVFTHPERRGAVEERYRAIFDAFDRAAASPV